MKNVHVITGGSSGIGLESAKQFKGDIVLITGRTKEKLENAAEELKKEGVQVEYKTSDISDIESVKQLFEYAKTLGNVKTIINSAGVSGVGVDAELTFKIDLIGAENLIKETLKCENENIVLILISSMMGHIVEDGELNKYLENPSEEGALERLIQISENRSDLAYNISKKGVHLLVKKYATEFGKKGNRILSISPGIIMTPMAEKAAEAHPERMNYMKAMTPMGRNGKPEDIAYAVEFLADDRASFITGTDLTIDGGLVIRLPEIVNG